MRKISYAFGNWVHQIRAYKDTCVCHRDSLQRRKKFCFGKASSSKWTAMYSNEKK